MTFSARNIALTTLVVVYSRSVLASHRRPRSYASHRHPPFLGDNENYRAETKLTFSEYNKSRWPSNTDDCLRSEIHLAPDDPSWYLRDGQVYDKRCLKTLVYLVEPEERAVCRRQDDCHNPRGYDNDCLFQLSFDQGFSFDFQEVKRLELQWKKVMCRGKTLDLCGRDHSLWWKSIFPSSRDDCRIHRRVGKEREDLSGDHWVQWSIGPDRMMYDNDCLSRFANRLGMENTGNCTQPITHNARGVPPKEIPKTVVRATNSPGIQPDLEVPTGVTSLSYLTAAPVATFIPLPEGSTTDVIPEPPTADIPDPRKGKRSGVPPSPIPTLMETADPLVPTSLPHVDHAQGPAADEWSCMWEVKATLPNPVPRLFDLAFGNATVDEIPLVAQRIVKGELEDLSECADALREEIRDSRIN